MQPDSERVVIESPSVRLARWLDADPERMAWVEHQRFLGKGWHVVLWFAPDTGSIASVFSPTRDAAVAAALDQAEGVRDAWRGGTVTLDDARVPVAPNVARELAYELLVLADLAEAATQEGTDGR